MRQALRFLRTPGGNVSKGRSESDPQTPRNVRNETGARRGRSLHVGAVQDLAALQATPSTIAAS